MPTSPLMILAGMVAIGTGQPSPCYELAPTGRAHIQELLAGASGVYVVTPVQSRLVGQRPPSWGHVPDLTSIEAIIEPIRLSAQLRIVYEFAVQETLLGPHQETLTLSVPNRGMYMNSTDFNLHEDREFWSDASIGRANLTPDCQIVAHFEYFESYIFIESDQPSVKSFERVTSRDDQFYRFIERYYNN